LWDGSLRTTVYLDKGVVDRVRRFIPQRGFSQLSNDLLQQKAAELEQNDDRQGGQSLPVCGESGKWRRDQGATTVTVPNTAPLTACPSAWVTGRIVWLPSAPTA